MGSFRGDFFRIALGHHIIWAINSVCHFSGHHPYDTCDHSTNVGWLLVLSFGESWHNHHHQAPTSVSFQHRWWQSDIGWAFIQLADRLGFASAVKRHEG